MDQTVNEMGKGDTFGELALLDPDNIRTAGIQCKVASEFLSVGKFDFNFVLKSRCKNAARHDAYSVEY